MKQNHVPHCLLLSLALLFVTLHSALSYYNPAAGKWLSRDPVGEAGGPNLYGFAYNDGISAIDLLGLDIVCNCPEAYFKENGIRPQMYTKSGDTYTAVPGAPGPTTGAGLVLWKMLLTKHTFTMKDLKVGELKKHVSARQTIVANALKANFRFGTGNRLNWTAFRDDPQGFFDKLNDGKTEIACRALSVIIFETGNRFRGSLARKIDGVWIPGDWAYIRNLAYDRNPGNWKDPETGRDRGEQGENIFHTGVGGRGDLFWGHSDHGRHASKTEKEWFDEIRNDWHKGNDGSDPEPAWRENIVYPKIGLQP